MKKPTSKTNPTKADKSANNSSVFSMVLHALTLPLQLYYKTITAPINYILYAQFCSKDVYADIQHNQHNCFIREIKIPITNQQQQPIELEGLCIDPYVLAKKKPYRTIFYIPGSFATIKHNCLPRLLETAEYMKARIILFNNEGCGDSPGNVSSLRDLRSSHFKAFQYLINKFNIKKLNIWSHSNGAYLHLSTLKDLANSLSKKISFGIQVLDRTHKHSDLIGPANFVINFLSTLTISFVITLTLYPIAKYYITTCLDTLLYNCLGVAMASACISSLFPETIGRRICHIFSLGKCLDNTYYAKQALNCITKNLGTIFSISHESDEIIGKHAQLNITKIPTINAKTHHINVTHAPYKGSKTRDKCDINHNMNLCGEKNAFGEDLLGHIREVLDANDESNYKL